MSADGASSGKIIYTLEFLQGLKSLKYDPPESVKQFADLYVFAPKPQVHRPRVGKAQKKAHDKPMFSPSERKELGQRRKEAAKKQVMAEQEHGDGQAEAAVGATAIQAILSDAQEQQACLNEVGWTATPGQQLIPRTKPKPKPAADEERHSSPEKPKRMGPGLSVDVEIETDEHKIAQRRKQIDFGYVTYGYLNYLKSKPKSERVRGDPQTPNALQKCSKRSWEGQMKIWRRQIHKYDIDGLDDVNDVNEAKAAEFFNEEERASLAKIRASVEARLVKPKGSQQQQEGAAAAVPMVAADTITS
eukprot:NODE_3825_length_1157_cov_70.854932_g3638_i0.p1 GENE.NODE_3825_length_1157_cov_70.854932_g3638_i0~~NODE_3825_length_1157_cov_70.854932_g3638_i0.p1  ORF type:complete len:303 (-),score=84.97 NODE_3825_length_1157_cov_70.854932_g3638_i0:140-1048(-)